MCGFFFLYKHILLNLFSVGFQIIRKKNEQWPKNKWIVELVAARNIATTEKKHTREDRQREIVQQNEETTETEDKTNTDTSNANCIHSVSMRDVYYLVCFLEKVPSKVYERCATTI